MGMHARIPVLFSNMQTAKFATCCTNFATNAHASVLRFLNNLKFFLLLAFAELGHRLPGHFVLESAHPWPVRFSNHPAWRKHAAAAILILCN